MSPAIGETFLLHLCIHMKWTKSFRFLITLNSKKILYQHGLLSISKIHPIVHLQPDWLRFLQLVIVVLSLLMEWINKHLREDATIINTTLSNFILKIIWSKKIKFSLLMREIGTVFVKLFLAVLDWRREPIIWIWLEVVMK